jgi:arylsulfatase A
MKKLFLVFILCFSLSFKPSFGQTNKQPNFIIILADDLGYGDLGCYGHPTIKTPNLDKMASEGIRFTQFYVGANVCTPSRAALLTGKLPVRNGITGGLGVFFPNSAGGLPTTETTIAKALKTKNYQTALVGKWHLGSMPQFMPNNHGFDEYFGIPYSNDMENIHQKLAPYPPLPLYQNQQIIEQNPDQSQLTKRFTETSIQFIEKNKNKPFFMYYANCFPHVPIFASEKFKGKSPRGLYGDVVAELDWSVGEIFKTLKKNGLDKNTFVVFMSDNGPWLTQKDNGGSAGLLFEGKGSAYEGGMRVPAIMRYPAQIQANQTTSALATSMDLFPTILKLAGIEPATYGELDGFDMQDFLKRKTDKIREVVYYYDNDQLYAIRKGAWKAHFTTHPSYSRDLPLKQNPPLLYNLDNDPAEKYEIGAKNTEILADLTKEFQQQESKKFNVPRQMDTLTTGPLTDFFRKYFPKLK